MRMEPVADHNDVSNPRTDIADLFVFRSPSDLGRSVLILNVHPDASEASASLDPAASYELKIDTDGDSEADVAIHVLFDSPPSGEPTATVYRSTGRSARRTGPIGEIVIARALVSVSDEVQITMQGGWRFFAGLRSDPWFADVGGFFNAFRFTGDDYFAGRNVLGIVLEAPHAALGANAKVQIWARTMAQLHGRATQMDQMGRPLINAVANQTDDDRSEFNRTPPAQQVAAFLARFVATFRSFGYGDAESRRLAAGLLPDVLPYDPSGPLGYPNGRFLTDDIADLRISAMTMGRVTGDGVGPHTDLLNEFPYLGAPH